MGKIIRIEGGNIYVGMKDGSLKEIPISTLKFTPVLNMPVEVYESATETIVVAKPVYNETQVEGVVVNKIAYVLLAFFLGGLGVHKFYAKKTMAGILYFIFCWTGIPALISLVEAIMALTKDGDANGNIIIK